MLRAPSMAPGITNTYLGGGGRQAANQPIRPSLATTAHLLLEYVRTFEEEKKGRKETHNVPEGRRATGQILTVPNPPWPQRLTPLA